MTLLARTWGIVGLGLWLSPGAALAAAALPADTREFFESQVRPLLSERCYQCHSTAQGRIKGGLELDWKGGWQQGGSSGAVIAPGDPEGSLLITAVRRTDPDLQMPPEGEPLKPVEVAVLERWVRLGAPDPRDQRSDRSARAGGTHQEHWVFQPIEDVAPPEVHDAPWPRNAIDQFILARLEAKGLTPSDRADRRTLIRRAYFDLVGLPPDIEAVNAFEADESPNAWEKIVDGLLASPGYGERWGRHWLDVARYSDTKGQINRNRDTSYYPHAWTYRDYVIEAFNEDKPYDEFIVEQLAADLLPDADHDPATLAALGFLTVGDRFNGMVHDIINDRIDVTTKAFLGLTVSCARCHDHMFDPVSTEDYYALHGVFNSSIEPDELPVITRPGSLEQQNDFQLELLRMEVEREELLASIVEETFGDYRSSSLFYLRALQQPPAVRAAYLQEQGVDPARLRYWQRLTAIGTRPDYRLFTSFLGLSRLSGGGFADASTRLFGSLEQGRQEGRFHPSVARALATLQPATQEDLATVYAALIAGDDTDFNATMRALVEDVGSRMVRGRMRNRYRRLNEQIAALELAHPGAPGRAMVVRDRQEPRDSPVFIRGDAGNRGELVPRRFIEVLNGGNAGHFSQGSGRLELARAIAAKSNPLTARVMVNRVWQHHFGTGFVDTPDDLGNQSEPPSHPELLDYLALRFMENGWSVKQLHRDVLLSATWQQASITRPDAAEADPFNRLLWRANVRRLEFEPIRDSLLHVGGQLDETMGGKPVDLSEGTHVGRRRNASMFSQDGGIQLSRAHRRSVYGFVDRADVMDMMSIFDFASPDLPTGRRFVTNVPQQALFLMNSPLVIEQARNIVRRPGFLALESEDARIRFLYGLLFQRLPATDEIELGRAFVRGSTDPMAQPRNGAKHSGVEMGVWEEYAHALLLTDEMCFIN